MRLVCVGSVGSDLPPDVLEKSGNTPASRFNVTVGQEYVARAMAAWTYGLGVLVVDDTGKPNWKPMDLFEVSDGRISPGWEFSTVKDRDPVLALWGYPTLIRDPRHHDDLIERKLPAYRIFLQETGDIDGDR
ncbi:MAG TPA: hypothetical protein VFV67_28940 [Actinophytocola sp.]|uniref:hypothetical protein n=1 Tax=Actinophytocola sp. TaxID=1872138 RepID=UPI002DBA9A0D|nr:hypothetical protein [Actinophytocola sp.]HEU5474694.1 hypothetical protein [Actinophytocola sp.]